MLLLLAVVAVLLVALCSGAGGQAGAVEPDGRTLCQEHPDWSVCQESARPCSLWESGFIDRLRVGRFGVWAVPTTRGLRMAGLPYERWQPSAWKLRHIEAVSHLRLYLADQEPTATWCASGSCAAAGRIVVPGSGSPMAG